MNVEEKIMSIILYDKCKLSSINISKLYSTSPSTVLKYLHRNNKTIRRKDFYDKQNMYHRVICMYKNGFSKEKISFTLELEPSVVDFYLKATKGLCGIATEV